MRINTSCVLNSIKGSINELRDDLRDVGCSPFHRPAEHEKANLSTSISEDLLYVEDSGLAALEMPNGMTRDAAAAANVVKSPVDILRSLVATSSAAITSPQPTYPDLRKFAKPTTSPKSPKSPFSAAAAAMDYRADGHSLLSRSQARRRKLQQSYNEIMTRSPTSIKEQHEQYKQQQQQKEEGRDDDEKENSRETYAKIKSPRVKKLYDFDIREDDHQVEEYTPTHQRFRSAYQFDNDAANKKGAQQWDDSQLRRAHRASLHKSAQLDIDEIEQFTKDMKLRIGQYSPKVKDVEEDEKDEKKKMMLKKMMFDEADEKKKKLMLDEFLEEKKKESLKPSSFKRQGHSDITQSSSPDRSCNTSAATKQHEDDKNDERKILAQRGIPDEKLEAWWNERQQNAKKSTLRGASAATFSATERFDQWWASQRQNQIKPHCGQGKSATAFRELEGEPTVEDDRNDTKKTGKENDTVVGGSNAVQTTPQEVPLSDEDHSQPAANNVASGTLTLILSRIDEAKAQFAKALEENDVKKQSELAALLARLGEAASAMRKLGEL